MKPARQATKSVYAAPVNLGRLEDLLCIVRANNLALPADCFRAIDGFDTTLSLAASEDREFWDRWLHHRNQMTYTSEVVV
jgi:hypothetical protein